ncbi:NADPH-dependent FMN reductase [Paraliomyxa miuraensis]|uniref:NADPH-dependent FMN reductase n=1 Tax=Paraliomyxa miuraensis TaxID=376150 RepID=UPI00225A8F95|nr:NAD(P)H-dependent oxidoreductase [Paraliomyxa miuraensis]MCX4244255.1 NAD(P)H-dependent oxidoreductase [Paraliomyxa miuraensis]
MSTKVLIVKGSTAHKSRLDSLADIAREAAEQTGGDIRMWDLQDSPLPVMSLTDPRQRRLPEVMQVREAAAEADGFIILTPEYHGNMSGALKNWFDFLYLELAGKFAGVLAVTGGGGGDMSITAVKNSFNWCHGFTLPFHAAARPEDFDGTVLVNEKVIERVRRVGSDVVRYAPLIRRTFEAARADGADWRTGVAGMHATKTD